MMEKYELNRESINYMDYGDSIVVRSGIWNHFQLIFEEKEFNGEFGSFRGLLKELFDGKAIELEDYVSTPYTAKILKQLADLHILVQVQPKLDESKDIYIIEKCFEEQFIKVFGNKRYLILENLMDSLSDNLESRMDYLAYKAEIEDCREKFKDITRAIVIASRPFLGVSIKLNRIFLELNIPWLFGFGDGSFLMVASFSPEYTGCFECLESQQMVRMSDLVNYINYKKDEKRYSFIDMDNTKQLFMLSLVKMLDKVNYYGIAFPLEGKVLSIYLPTFEINISPLLRIPTCPACGNVSIAKSTDYNICAHNILSEVIKNA